MLLRELATYLNREDVQIMCLNEIRFFFDELDPERALFMRDDILQAPLIDNDVVGLQNFFSVTNQIYQELSLL